MSRRLSRCSLLSVLMLGACAIPSTIEQLEDSSPPPEFGRPQWVRATAGFGGWVGGVIGGVGAIALLPITWPLSEVCEDELGEQSKEDLMLFPATGLATVGHCLLGAPADLIDWSCRRLWTEQPDPVTQFDATPLDAVELPTPPTAEESAETGR